MTAVGHAPPANPAAELPAVSAEVPSFSPPISCSNLVEPDLASVLASFGRSVGEGRLTDGGPMVEELEARLARFHQTSACVTFGSGFWALVLALRALALPGRREVVMPSLTYRRMADVAAWAQLTPRFCDVDPDTLAISPEAAAASCSQDTAVLLGVHPIVNCCPADQLEAVAAAHGLPLLIDAVESCYEHYHGRKVGSFGDAEVFSLHASKLLNGCEGGYLTTNDVSLAARLTAMRSGDPVAAGSRELGIRACLPEIHAAIAVASLEDLEAQVERNRSRYRTYQATLARLQGLRLVPFDEREPCSFKNILVELTEEWPLSRDATVARLNERGVLARAYYAPALHRKESPYRTERGPLPVTEALESRFLLLPSGARVTSRHIERLGTLLAHLGGLTGHVPEGGQP